MSEIPTSHTTGNGLRKIGEAIGFSALVASATYLEASGHEAGGLWGLIVLWAIFL